MKPLADWSTQEAKVRPPPVCIQPVAAYDVATKIGAVCSRAAANGVVEISGPNKVRLNGLVRHTLTAIGDSREVIADPNALYFGAHVEEDTLVLGLDAELSSVSLDDWLDRGHLRK